MDESDGLENRYGGNLIVGSNPTPSARIDTSLARISIRWSGLLLRYVLNADRVKAARPFNPRSRAHWRSMSGTESSICVL